MEERGGVDDETVVRSEDAEVGVVAGFDAALAPQPGELRRPLGHPACDVDEGEAAPPRLGPHVGEADLQGGDAAPRLREVAQVESLELRGARRVVGDDAVDRPVGESPPQLLAVVRLPDGRAALELRRPSRDLLGRERQVVRTGLGGDPDAVPARLGDEGERVAAGEVEDVRPSARGPGGLDDPADGAVLRHPWP